MCDSRLIAPYPREPLTHCAWSRRQGVRAGNLSYLDPMFFRAGRLVDRMSSSSLDSRPRILQFIASLEQQLAVRITTRSRKSSKKKALSTLFSWTACNGYSNCASPVPGNQDRRASVQFVGAGMPVSIPAVELDLPPAVVLALFVVRPDSLKTVQTP